MAAGLVPPAMARRLRRIGIGTVRDLLFHLPRRYDDFSELVTLRALRDRESDEPVSARVQVVSLDVSPTFRRRVQRTVARLRDETGEAEAVWFGRRFIERRLAAGDEVIVSGKVQLKGWLPSFQNPEFARPGTDSLAVGRIVPVYRLTEGVTANWLRRAVRSALDSTSYDDYLADRLLAEAGDSPPTISEALESAHYPVDFDARNRALDRLAFDELLALQIGMVSRDRIRRGTRGVPIEVSLERVAEAVARVEAALTERVRARLPEAERDAFMATLTPDQAAAVDAIRSDLGGPRPMHRLLQGDVGSGKTAVAAIAIAFTADAGHQAALLAPTDLLARQHAVTLRALLEPLGHRVDLLTGSLPAKERREIVDRLAAPPGAALDGSTSGLVVVGTHALVQERIAFADLALAVVDEQHRFGVEEREALSAKGAWPHVLLMTATPIPQTLARVVHADLDVSDLRTAPAGRQVIGTGVRSSEELRSVKGDPTRGTWPLVVNEVAAGYRAFVVVPLIEEDESGSARSADSTAEELRGVLGEIAARHLEQPDIRTGVVHGQMKAADRDAVMTRFRDGELNVIVGTTVLEVGVDVPEATVMVILDADRFGVAQLHQLRGRVGRGERKSFCVLVSDSDDETAQARLKAVESTQDGFALAEMDLQLRREGELLGLSQSGLPPLRVASLARKDHQELSARVRRVAETLVDESGRLLPGYEALAAELQSGWLARVGAGEVMRAGEEEAAA